MVKQNSKVSVVKLVNIKKILKTIKQNEYFFKVILGVIIITIVGVFSIDYLSKRQGQTIPGLGVGDETQLTRVHTVQKGENLWKISEKYFGTGYNWVDIAQENKISNPDLIEEGKELKIPDVQPKIPQKTPATPTETVTPNTLQSESIARKAVHRVEKGQNLWKISEEYFGSGYNWIDIARVNSIKNSNLIYEGQELIIPDVKPRTITSILDGIKTEKPAISDTTYTVTKGDSLWSISVRAYGDGFKWVEIARKNKLTNPNLIHAGNVLVIPR